MLKCKMVFGYPKEYMELYESSKDGSCLREWINHVERMARAVQSHDPAMNTMMLRKRIPATWDVRFADNYFITPPNDKTTNTFLEKNPYIDDFFQRCAWNGDCWKARSKQVVGFLYANEINKFRGDMLEVFSEIFFTVFGADEGVGISNYEPMDIGNDYGVDATGTNVNGHKVAVQVKYRGNPNDLIPYADIARTYTSATLQLGLSDVANHDHTIYLFTTSSGVTGAFEKVMGRKCVIVNRAIIQHKVDNNKEFWLRAHDMMRTTLTP